MNLLITWAWFSQAQSLQVVLVGFILPAMLLGCAARLFARDTRSSQQTAGQPKTSEWDLAVGLIMLYAGVTVLSVALFFLHWLGGIRIC